MKTLSVKKLTIKTFDQVLLEIAVKDPSIHFEVEENPSPDVVNYMISKHEPGSPVSTHEMESVPANPDYSHLIGKWVKSKFVFDTGRWVEVRAVSDDFIYVTKQEHMNTGSWIEDLGFISYPPIYLDLSDPRDSNPDEEERVIPFDIERWRRGDYVRAQTRNGKLVSQLTEFDTKETYQLVGVLEEKIETWNLMGIFNQLIFGEEYPNDLTLVVKGGEQ